jgi:DNA (cytosine-5)-methyltransferase 1
MLKGGLGTRHASDANLGWCTEPSCNSIVGASPRPDATTSMLPRYLSLFAGCGGLDLGFRRAGYRCVGAYELNGDALNTFNTNLAPDRAIRADLSSWRKLDFPRRIDIVIAGPPCQGFSTAGARRENDPRNGLLLVPIEVAIRVRASVVVVENVPGALTGSPSTYWRRAERRLATAGFSFKTIRLDSAAAGLPQLRQRVFLVAHRDGDIPEWYLPASPAPTLASVLAVPASAANHCPRPLRPGSNSARIAEHIKAGQKLCNVRSGNSSVHAWDIPEVFGAVTPTERYFLEELLHLRRRARSRDWGDADAVSSDRLRKALGASWFSTARSLLAKRYLRRFPKGFYDLRHTFNGKYRRLDPQRPTNCVLTKFCQPEYFLHPYDNRAFTIREAARIQGFPDDFVFQGSLRAQAQQVGNAVPPPVGELIAAWLESLL